MQAAHMSPVYLLFKYELFTEPEPGTSTGEPIPVL